MFFNITTVSAEFLIEEKKINFDLNPKQIKNDTYFPLDELIDNKLIGVDKINDDKFLVLTKNRCYLLETGKTIMKVNKKFQFLDVPPLKINGYFLIPFEFINEYLGFEITNSKTKESSTNFNKNNIEDNLKLKINFNDDEIAQSENLKIQIEVINTSKESVILKFNTSQKYNIKLKNKSMEVIYSWEKGKIFTQALKSIEIDAEDSLIFKEEVALNQFSKGEYILEFEFLSSNYNFQTLKKEVKIQN
jgi:hypothetical protein